MPKPIKGLPNHVQSFFVCIIFHMVFPALPLVFELIESGRIAEKALVLFTSLYAATIGVSSRNQLVFGSTMLVSIVFSFVYGFTLRDDPVPLSAAMPTSGVISESIVEATTSVDLTTWIAIITLICLVVQHVAERYNMHVVDEIPFLAFVRSAAGHQNSQEAES